MSLTPQEVCFISRNELGRLDDEQLDYQWPFLTF
jgi:hypothetical protein